jgi:Zn-finger nucleic acid-binding protein
MPAHGPCPHCGGELVPIERSGVRIDACRQCRGVWLDRGELDTILERERSYVAGTHDDDEDFFREMSGRQDRQQSYGFDKHTAERLLHDFKSHKSHKHKHRKKSVLDELFD